jgi:hypothetical protein
MPELIALRAAFGQDEANHGIRRYRVGGDGLVHVPVEAALFLVSKGGFVVANTAVDQVPGSSLPALPPDGRSAADPSSRVRLHHDGASGFGHCGCKHQGDPNNGTLVPAEAAGDLLMHGFLSATPDLRPGVRDVVTGSIGRERSSVGDATSTSSPSAGG